MDRGSALQWGFELDTDGKQWNVTVHGSQKPDFTFPGIEAFIEWLREENEGLLISRLAKKVMVPLPEGAIDREPVGAVHGVVHYAPAGDRYCDCSDELVRSESCPIHGGARG